MHRLFTSLFCLCIFATLAGGIGGSFQPARVLLVGMAGVAVMFPINLQVNFQLLKQIFTLILFIIISGIVSLAWTSDVIGGVGMLLAVAVGCCAIFVISRTDLSTESVSRLIWSWFGVVTLSLPVAFYEIATGNHFQFSMESRVIGGNFGEFPFAAIFFGNHNDYSTWLCLAFPMSMAAFFEARGLWVRAGVILVNLAIVGIILINTSRAALIYISLVAAVYIAKFPAVRRYTFAASILVFPGVIARYRGELLNLYDLIIYRFMDGGSLTLADDQRTGLIGAGLNGILENWGLGMGVGGFEEYVSDNYPYLIPNPHNILIEIAVNFGLLALVLFVCLIVALFLCGFRRKDLSAPLRICLMLGSIGVPIVGTIPSQAISYVYWWVWLATMIAIAASPRNSPNLSPPDTFLGRGGLSVLHAERNAS